MYQSELVSLPDTYSIIKWQDLLSIITFQLKVKEEYKKRFDREDELISALWNDKTVRKQTSTWLKTQFKKKEFSDKSEGKSSIKSKLFKEMGNEKFQMKKYPESIEFYTKSALYAPADSVELSVALANRSAALFYLGRYQDCLKDLDSAIALNYPLAMRYKLYLRAAQCYVELKEAELANKSVDEAQGNIKDSNEMAPSAKANLEKRIAELKSLITVTSNNSNQCTNKPKNAEPYVAFRENLEFPSASAAIDRRYTVEKGRHVVANRFIKENAILFVEKAVAPLLIKNETNSICEKCHKDYNDHPVPCTTCINTFYCNVSCMKEAWSSYHCWECPGNQIDMWKDAGIAHLTLRLLLTSATTLTSTELNEIQQLVTNFEKVSYLDLLTYGVVTVVLTTYLREHTDFFEAIDIEQSLVKKFSEPNPTFHWDTSVDNNKQVYIGSLILRYILQLIANASTIAYEGAEAITALFPSASMMNHSCAPNIITSFHNGCMVVKAARDIRRGEEIYNCYGPHYRTMSTESRQKVLEQQYHFKCKCSACTSKLQY